MKYFFSIIFLYFFFLLIYFISQTLVYYIFGYVDFSVFVLVVFLFHTIVFFSYMILFNKKEELKNEFSFNEKKNISEVIYDFLNVYSFNFIFLGLILLLLMVIFIFIQNNSFYYSYFERIKEEYNFYPNKPISGIILMLVIAPIFEEFYFRYLMVKQFKKINESKLFIIIGIGILFIFAHEGALIFSNGDLNYARSFIAIAFEIGLASSFLTIIYLKTNKLIYPIIGHFIWNFVDLIFLNLSYTIPNKLIVLIIEFIVILIFIAFLFLKNRFILNKIDFLKNLHFDETLISFSLIFFILVGIFQYFYYSTLFFIFNY